MSPHVVIAGQGDPCPRCSRATENREHRGITERELRRPFYYARWFYCVNPRCRTTVIVPDRYRVFERRTGGAALEQLSLAPLLEPSDLVTAASSAEVPG